MNTEFDKLAKGLAQSVTRRHALKEFGVGLAGMVLACFGLPKKAEADRACVAPSWCDPSLNPCCCTSHCKTGWPSSCANYQVCVEECAAGKGIYC